MVHLCTKRSFSRESSIWHIFLIFGGFLWGLSLSRPCGGRLGTAILSPRTMSIDGNEQNDGRQGRRAFHRA